MFVVIFTDLYSVFTEYRFFYRLYLWQVTKPVFVVLFCYLNYCYYTLWQFARFVKNRNETQVYKFYVSLLSFLW